MSYKVTNISDGQLVNTLASGNTLRLNVGEHTTITDSDITDYLTHLEGLGMLKMEKIEEKTSKKSQKDKEE